MRVMQGEYWDDGWGEKYLSDKLFQFIQWKDQEPYNIQELIEEYEDEEYGYFNMKLSREFEKFIEESEETEVKKDKKWLKEAILALKNKGNPENNQTEKERELGRAQQWAWNNCVDRAYEIAKQLDEPEVLSRNWISENITESDIKGNGYVAADALYGILVPKQGELETKIQELIESYKQEEDAYSNPENGWIGGFIEDLKNLVEKEQKYQVKNSHGRTLLAKMTYSHKGKTFEKVEPYNELIVGYKKELTEQEIKDYDERYWPFAVKVEELEE